MLKLERVACGYRGKPVLEEVSFAVQSGEVLCLLGPNGSGKSTLFKSILGLLPLQKGAISIDKEDISMWSQRRLARTISYIPQAHIPPFPFKVLDVVLMGRTAHLNSFASPSEKDVIIARRAIATLNISHLEDKSYTEISGGERQLVLIARALTQEPRILIMDEPTNNLDFGNQVLVLSHIQRLARMGLAIIMSSHFPEHAFHYATQVVLLKNGRVYSTGLPEKTVTEKSLYDLYGVQVTITHTTAHNGDRVKVCVPAAC